MNRRNFLKLGVATGATGVTVANKLKPTGVPKIQPKPIVPKLDEDIQTRAKMTTIVGLAHSGKSRHLIKLANKYQRMGKSVALVVQENLYNHIDVIHPDIDYTPLSNFDDVMDILHNKQYDVVFIDDIQMISYPIEAGGEYLMKFSKSLRNMYRRLMEFGGEECYVAINYYRQLNAQTYEPLVSMPSAPAYMSDKIIEITKGVPKVIKYRGSIV